jgi:hypothetical protein
MKLAALLLLSSVALAQKSATTSGPCSPIASGNTGTITINCPVMSKKQEQEMVSVLNKILRDRLDPKSVMAVLNQLGAEVSHLSSLIPTTAGELLPAGDQDPPSTCPDAIPKDALKVFLGAALLYSRNKSVDAVAIGSETLVSLERSSTGTLLINTTVRSPDGRIIAQVVSGKFFINPNNYYRVESDKSTLTVYDQQGRIALKVRYINPLAVLVMGNFVGKGGTLTIDEREIVVNGGLHVEGGCFKNPQLGGDLFEIH